MSTTTVATISNPPHRSDVNPHVFHWLLELSLPEGGGTKKVLALTMHDVVRVYNAAYTAKKDVTHAQMQQAAY